MYRLILISGILFWPLNLFKVNTTVDFTTYFIPAIFLGITLLWIKNKSSYYLLPILLIPLLEPKLTFLPFMIISIICLKKLSKTNLIYVFISLVVILIKWNSFYGQTIFVPDYQKRQEVLRNINLYNSIFLARITQNKVKIVYEKLSSNFFEITDPNNYFFGFSPRQMIGNQNIVKFPYPLIPIFLFGLINFNKIRHKEITSLLFISSVVSLSFLNNFDRQDFILWIPLSLFFIESFRLLNRKSFKFKKLYYLITLFMVGVSYYQILS